MIFDRFFDFREKKSSKKMKVRFFDDFFGGKSKKRSKINVRPSFSHFESWPDSIPKLSVEALVSEALKESGRQPPRRIFGVRFVFSGPSWLFLAPLEGDWRRSDLEEPQRERPLGNASGAWHSTRNPP